MSLNFSLKQKIFFFSFLSLFLLVFPKVFAQSMDSVRLSDLKNDIRYNELKLNNLRKSAAPTTQYNPIIWEEVRENYSLLQIANNYFQQLVFSGKPLNEKLLKEQLNKIKKTASRLKVNLPLPQIAKTEIKAPIENMTFQNLSKQLDETINLFVKSPIFKETRILNVEIGDQAARDLQNIINLSSCLHRNLKTSRISVGK